jgi:catechol 2,3-dioxygenase-like lactoylglutathione lyase family enzyme
MDHLALPVCDQQRSLRFYATYFGFDPASARPYDDGVIIVHDEKGFSLALGPTDDPPAMPPFFHFGFHAESPEDVRAMRDRLAADGVEIAEEWEEPEYVSVKCLDPDGYVVEFGWEPPPDSSD